MTQAFQFAVATSLHSVPSSTSKFWKLKFTLLRFTSHKSMSDSACGPNFLHFAHLIHFGNLNLQCSMLQHSYMHFFFFFSTVLGILNSPIRSILGKPSGYLHPESMSMTADFLEKFPSMARMANRLDSSSFLDSRSSSPEDSETSGFSSGSDHLCDMLVSPHNTHNLCNCILSALVFGFDTFSFSGNVSLQSTLRISPPLPYLASNMQKDLLRLGSRLDPQDSSSPMTPPSSASPASSAISRRWRTSSPWPGASMLDQSDDAFSIEREARLHRQAAGTSIKNTCHLA